MRHYNVPRLNSPNYYVVFCDCGRELQRFVDNNSETGRQQFDRWLGQAIAAEPRCNGCFQPPVPILTSEFFTTTDVAASMLVQSASTRAHADGVPAQTGASPNSFTKYLDEMAGTIQTMLAEFDMTRANLDEKREACKRVSHIAATACAAVALQPIPIADVLLLTPIQILMVQAIGRIYNVPLTNKTAYEVATNIGLGVLLQQIFIAIVKLGVPMMGGVLVSTYVYSATYYMGRIAQIYFEKGRPLTAAEQQQVQTSFNRAENRLREIDQLKQQQLITEEEYQRKRTQIIDEI